MARTYGELMTEYQNFEYSKENYELTKECYELDLMTRYIESQEFMMENMDEIREEFKEFNESYFIEAAETDTVENVSANTKSKAKSIFERIINGLKRLWENISNFFAKIFGKFEEEGKKTKELVEKISNDVGVAASINKNGKSLYEELTKIWNATGDKYGFVIMKKQPGNKPIKVLFSKIENREATLGLLTAALSDTTVILNTSSTIPKDMDIVDVRSLAEIVEAFSRSSSTFTNNTIKHSLDTKIQATKKSGLVISVYGEDITTAKQEIKAAKEKLNSLSADKLTEEMATSFKEIYAKLTVVSGNLMKAYSSLSTYRSKARNVIEKLCSVKIDGEDIKVDKEAKNTKNEEKTDTE